MKNPAMVAIVAVAFSVPVAVADDATTLPTVTVTGPRIGGGNVICRSTACEGVLRALAGPDYYIETNTPFQPDRVTKPLDPERVCANLEQAEPPDCDIENPPSTPGYDSNWIANGCGDGTVASDVGMFLARLFLPNHTGDLDDPLPGISFYGACAGHDKCYGSGGNFLSKGMCDKLFGMGMAAACDAGSPTYAAECSDIGAAYVSAVETPFGDDAYAAAQSNTACAAWASDMETNGCDE